jgi:hypothetical protein
MADKEHMNRQDNWQGFCRAYGRQFNISYAAAICEAGPAWLEYKKLHGYQSKQEKKQEQRAVSTPMSDVNSIRRITPEERLLMQQHQLEARKQGKRPREEEGEEQEESWHDGVGDQPLNSMIGVTRPMPPVGPAVAKPAPKKRRSKKQQGEDNAIYYHNPHYGAPHMQPYPPYPYGGYPTPPPNWYPPSPGQPA